MKKIVSIILSVLILSSTFSIGALAAEEEDRFTYIYMCRDASVIQNEELIQKIKVSGAFTYAWGVDFPSLGVVYSSVNEIPQIGESNTIDLVCEYNEAYLGQIMATTEALQDETTYYVRTYASYSDGEIVYSDVLTYTTAITIPQGGQVGCTNIVSGASYHIDNGTATRAPSHMAFIDSGYSALYNGWQYSTGDSMVREGYNSLITTDLNTNKRYLHIFELEFAKRAIELGGFEVSDESSEEEYFTRFSASYRFVSNEENNIQEAGVVYSKNALKLEIGHAGTTKVEGTVSEGVFIVSDQLPALISDTYYIRGYVKADSKYYYYNYATKFTVTSQSYHGTAGDSLFINNLGKTQSYTQTIPANCKAKIGSTTYYAGETIELNEDGKYYILHTWSDDSNSMTFVEIDKTAPVISNITDNEIFNGPVIPDCKEYGAFFYISKDGGEEKDFADGVKISESGSYVLKAFDSTNNFRTYYFEIKQPVVTTQDCWYTTTHTAEISANFINNGSVLYRGFVFSAINDTPLIGALACTTFVPQDDPYPSFLTVTITDLPLNTKHFFRAFIATGDAQNPTISYGDIKEFTTQNIQLPSVMINYPSNVMPTSMTINCFLMSDGGTQLSEMGIVYSTSPNPSVNDVECTKIAAETAVTGGYSIQMTGLLPETTYYIRAYAINDVGTADSSYDFVMQTTALPKPPTIGYTVKNGFICGVTVGNTVSQFLQGFSGMNVEVYDKGKLADVNMIVASGMIVKTYLNGILLNEYTVLIYGDINGDGAINAFDLIEIKKHLLKIKYLSGFSLAAGSFITQGSISAIDLLMLKRHLLGMNTIAQS